MSHQFYLTLPSDSSMSYYPNNTIAKYTTKLAYPIELDGDYEMGLAELIYPHSWYNFDNKNEAIYIEMRRRGDTTIKFTFPSGGYSSEEELMDAFNKHIENLIRENQLDSLLFKDMQLKLEYNKQSRKLVVSYKHPKLSKSTNSSIMKFHFSKAFGEMFGVSSDLDNDAITMVMTKVSITRRGDYRVYIYSAN